MTAIAQKIEPLHVLADGRRDGVKYFRSLLNHTDEFVRCGAICWLIDKAAIGPDDYEAVLAMRRMPCIREKAFSYVASRFGPQKAEPFRPEDAHATNGDPSPSGPLDASDPEADVDSQDLLDTEIGLFQQNGRPVHLFQASIHAEGIGGWRAAIEWSVRAMLLTPMRPQPAWRTMNLLFNANKYDDLQSVLDKFAQWDLFPVARAIAAAGLLLDRGEVDDFFARIATVPVDSLPPQMRTRTYGMIAGATAKKGDFVGAVKWFEMQNTLGEPPNRKRMRGFLAEINMLEELPIGNLPPDERTNHVMMLGFPRSGTTLLESALSSHSELETFEEVPSFKQVINHLRDRLAEIGKDALSVDDYLAARRRYYEYLDIRTADPAAFAYIDKLPIRSAYAGFLRRFFPDKRFIFSIRHPYDVVLSCFKTPISPNMAMEHFKLFDDACALYDRVMTTWFTHFPQTDSGGDEHVCPVRYDALVLDFEAEMRRILAFLGVDWRDEVGEFAAAAEKRKVRTPSYRKVRQGLTIGVQSSWQDYRFLFETPAAAVLHPWVERLDYEGLS